MATGWAPDGAVTDQIDSTIADAVARSRSGLSSGLSHTHCVECGNEIPEGRQRAIQGVRLCVACQQAQDQAQRAFSGYNRRGSKDSQLR